MWAPGTSCLRTSILATWVDHVAGLAAIQVLAPRVPVTLELDVHVYGRAPASGTVHAVARLIKAGRSVVVSEVDLSDDAGDPVAIGTASFMVAPDPRVELPSNLSLDMPLSALGRLRRPFAERAGWSAPSRGWRCCPAPTTGSTRRARSTAA